MSAGCQARGLPMMAHVLPAGSRVCTACNQEVRGEAGMSEGTPWVGKLRVEPDIPDGYKIVAENGALVALVEHQPFSEAIASGLNEREGLALQILNQANAILGLEAQVAALQADNAKLHQRLSDHGAEEALEERLRLAQADKDALRKALAKYGSHVGRCEGFDCECGFSAIAQVSR